MISTPAGNGTQNTSGVPRILAAGTLWRRVSVSAWPCSEQYFWPPMKPMLYMQRSVDLRPQAARRVFVLISEQGLGSLWAYDVSLLLRYQTQGAPFAASFRKRKVC